MTLTQNQPGQLEQITRVGKDITVYCKTTDIQLYMMGGMWNCGGVERKSFIIDKNKYKHIDNFRKHKFKLKNLNELSINVYIGNQ